MLKYCDKCTNPETHLYYCEFCDKNFCSNCTLEEAHDKNYTVSAEIGGCNQIHTKIDTDDEPDEVDMSMDDRDTNAN